MNSRCGKCGVVVRDIDAGFSLAIQGMTHSGCGGLFVADKWLIYSIEHGGRWWAPAAMGYVAEREKAGRFEFHEALQIVFDANRFLKRDFPDETMCPDF